MHFVLISYSRRITPYIYKTESTATGLQAKAALHMAPVPVRLDVPLVRLFFEQKYAG